MDCTAKGGYEQEGGGREGREGMDGWMNGSDADRWDVMVNQGLLGK